MTLQDLLSAVSDRRCPSVQASDCLWIAPTAAEAASAHTSHLATGSPASAAEHTSAEIASSEITGSERSATRRAESDRQGGSPAALHYHHCNPELGIDFLVQKLPFEALQVMDARLVRIAPLASNEKHRHAHESIFVVLSGGGELQIDSDSLCLQPGSVASVPRWIPHQSHNRSSEEELILLAITDFGLTSAVLGDYDARTRLRRGGDDAFPPDPGP